MSGKLKAVAKKVAKKAAKKAVKAVKVAAPAPVMISKRVIKKFVSEGRTEEKTMDEMEELQEENRTLREELAQLKDDALRGGAAAIKDQARRWIRGKLPGERLIKTDPDTGKYEEIDKAEWDSLR